MADEAQMQPKETLTRSVKATDIAREVCAMRRAFYARVHEAHDGVDLISRGRHERFIISKEKFDRKMSKKSKINPQ